MCDDSKQWYNEEQEYQLINMFILNEDVLGYS